MKRIVLYAWGGRHLPYFGAHDGGNLLLLQAFGYSDVTGITFALLRRFRELVWIRIGLVYLLVLGGEFPGRLCRETRKNTRRPS